jgi:hypothetical protein
MYAGNVSTSRTTAVQSSGDPGRIVQAARSSRSSAGGRTLRRRLSRIFQRAMTGSVFGTARPLASGTVRHNQRAICQSPRIHLCWRAANDR